MLDIKNAICQEDDYSWVFKCTGEGCSRLIKSKPYYLKNHSGKCRSCMNKKRPFFHLFNRMKNSARASHLEFRLSFEDFLEFTKLDKCHYCVTSITWLEYCYHNSKFITAPYYIDRMDNSFGYIKSNCTICCSRCNKAKSSKYSYQEWYGMTKYFRDRADV